MKKKNKKRMQHALKKSNLHDTDDIETRCGQTMMIIIMIVIKNIIVNVLKLIRN